MIQPPSAGDGPHAPARPFGSGRARGGGRISASVRDTVRLAAPAVVARAGLLLLITADTVMVGQHDTAELAYFALSFPVQMVLILLAAGALQGGLVLTSQAFGARLYARTGDIWRIGILHAAGLGVLAGLAATQGGALLRLTGQDPALVAGAERVLFQFAWGVPGMLIYIMCAYYLEGIRRPQVGMAVMMAANGVNILLNAVLVNGWLGLAAPMGAEGAVLATSIVRWLSVLAMLGYILTMPGRHRLGTVRHPRRTVSPRGRVLGRRFRALGLPVGLALGFETTAVAALMLMAGRLGAGHVAAQQILMQMVQLVQMLAIGAAAATAVRVGMAVGRRDAAGMRLAGWTGGGLIVALALPFALTFAAAPGFVAGLFSGDGHIVALAVPGVRIAAAVVMFAVFMAVMLGALRGAGDVWLPLALHGGAYWLVMVPVAAAAAFALGWGAAGIMTGYLAGAATSAVFQCLRFAHLSGRPPSSAAVS